MTENMIEPETYTLTIPYLVFQIYCVSRSFENAKYI